MSLHIVLPASAREIAQEALRWATERQPLPVRRALASESDGAIGQRLWAEIQDLGWTGMLVPQKHGGMGGDLVQACAIAHVCGQSLLALPWLEHAVLATTVLLHCPAGHARDRALSALATRPFTLAAAESGQRGLLQTPACAARAEGGGWRLHGTKSGVAGPQARSILVTARLDPGEGLGLFLVDRDADRVDVQPGRGLDGRSVGAIAFDVALPQEALLAQDGAAWTALAHANDAAALAACAEAAAIAAMALEHTLEHLRTRQQFGQPIGRFQVLQHRAADMFVAMRYAAALAWATIEEVAAQPRDDHAMAVASAKAETLRLARVVLAGATQLHGAMGVVDEMPISHGLKRVLVLEASFGDRSARLGQLGAWLADGAIAR